MRVSRFSIRERHRYVPNTATSGCSARMYSARWLPANPVIPVMRTRIPANISKGRAVGRLPGPLSAQSAAGAGCAGPRSSDLLEYDLTGGEIPCGGVSVAEDQAYPPRSRRGRFSRHENEHNRQAGASADPGQCDRPRVVINDRRRNLRRMEILAVAAVVGVDASVFVTIAPRV